MNKPSEPTNKPAKPITIDRQRGIGVVAEPCADHVSGGAPRAGLRVVEFSSGYAGVVGSEATGYQDCSIVQ